MNQLKDLVSYTKELRLLYVEDDKNLIKACLPLFQELFLEVVIAYNGEEGCEKLSLNKIDLILTDISMPVMNGLEMIENVRKEDTEIPIVILSAYSDVEYFMESIRLNVDGYLLKPIELQQLIAVFLKIAKKIAMQKELQREKLFLQQYQEAADEGVIVSKTDKFGIISYVNDEFCRVSGYTREELIGKNHNIIRHPDNPKSLYKEMWDTIQNKKKIWKGIIRNLSKEHKSYYVKTIIKPIIDEQNNIVEYIALREDVTELMHPKAQLRDAVANIENPCLIYIQIEDFGMLEELYASKVLQELQKETQKILEDAFSCVASFEQIYNIDNGLYAFVISIKKESSKVFQEIQEVQKSLQNSVVYINDIKFELTFLLSLAYKTPKLLESAAAGIEELAKSKEDFIIANELIEKRKELAQKNMQIIDIIKSALESGKIISYFQPIIENKTGQIVKYESLVRLVNEKGEVLSPYYFLDVAKKSKYYSEVTRRVLKNSFKALQQTDKDLSINLSIIDIENRAIREEILTLLAEHKSVTHRIVFEMLEDENVKDFAVVKAFIKQVKAMGVKIAIDDFGTGYSNFERLLEYKPDFLKIDGSLVKNIVHDTFSRSIVKTIVLFAKDQGFEVIAEFVENEEIYAVLKELGVEYSQGYYFGAPKAL